MPEYRLPRLISAQNNLILTKFMSQKINSIKDLSIGKQINTPELQLHN